MSVLKLVTVQPGASWQIFRVMLTFLVISTTLPVQSRFKKHLMTSKAKSGGPPH